jgi:hypothetical protein
MTMSRKILTLCLVLIVAISVSACKKKTVIKGLELEILFSEEKLSDNLITDLQYKWKTGSEFVKLNQDFNVFVHFWHKNNLLFQDDHNPEVPVSQWEPEKEYTYTRRIYIPTFIDEFDPNFRGEDSLRLSAGFVSPYDRTGDSKQEILVEKLKVFPPPLDTPEVIYEEGWYDLEINPDAYLKQWRWTSQKARCIIDNPHRDALLIIKGGINANAFESQTIIFKINDLTLDEFIPEGGIFEKSYSIKKEMLGDKEEFYLTIETDKFFIPAELSDDTTDDRVLGLQVSFIYFR